MQQLTNKQFHEARSSLGLSLSRVAKETGINRNLLSNFEKKKQFLDDQAKARLRDFYLGVDADVFNQVKAEPAEIEAQDGETSSEAVEQKAPQPVKRDAVSLLAEMGYRLVDGLYVVPAGSDDEIIDEAREVMTDIDEAIQGLVSAPLPTSEGGFFSDDDELDERAALRQALDVVVLLARKQIQHDLMQGHSLIEPVKAEGSVLAVQRGDLSTFTVGELVARLLHPANDWLSEVK